ncbi:MAG: DinB family protein, partial [Acidobacteriota bacterium]
AIGIPNSGSADFGWPGVDATVTPTLDDAAATWQERSRLLRQYLDDVEPAALTATVDVLENGTTAARDCIGVVFEEHFHHLRYALRDLDRLG